ncbi:MAG: fucose permease [Clostridiaceae bacterium]|jgi:fucose permease|nr:fucose permease [Clostridiaceae bacterium]
MERNYKHMVMVFIGLFFVSLFSNTLSPFITTIKSFYNVNSDFIAVLPSVVFIASSVMNVLGFKLISILGLKNGLSTSIILCIAASILIFFSKSFYILLIGYFLSGLGIGMSYLFLSTILSLLPKKYQKFSLYNAFFGFGGILILPMARLIILNRIPFNYTYLIHITTLSIYLIFVFKLKNAPKVSSKFTWSSIGSILKSPLVLYFSLAIFFYVGAEASTTSWTGSFLERYYGVSTGDVPNILLGFWILFTTGRVIGDFFINKLGQLKLLIISSFGAIFGIAITLTGSLKIQAFIGIAVIGIMISIMYPAIQGYMVQNVSTSNIPATSTIIGIFNSLGAMVLTYIIGIGGNIKISYVFILQIFFYVYIAFVSSKFLIKS